MLFYFNKSFSFMIHYASTVAARGTQRINYCRRNASRITIWNRDFTRHDHERGITFSFALCSLSVLHTRPFRTIASTVQITVHSKNGFKRNWVINLKSAINWPPIAAHLQNVQNVSRASRIISFVTFLSSVCCLAGKARRTNRFQRGQSVHILMSLVIYIITISGCNLQ